MLRKTMIVLLTAAALTGGLTADAFAGGGGGGGGAPAGALIGAQSTPVLRSCAPIFPSLLAITSA